MDDRVKIAVVGNTSSGKTSLVRYFCEGQPVKNIEPTNGCDINILMYEFKTINQLPKNFFIEFYDISGSDDFNSCHHLYFKNINGIILVHDLSNPKSITSLNKWLWTVLKYSSSVLLKMQFSKTKKISDDLNFPILIVGTKHDLNPNWIDKKHIVKQLQEQFNCNSIKINTLDDCASFIRPDSKSGNIFTIKNTLKLNL